MQVVIGWVLTFAAAYFSWSAISLMIELFRDDDPDSEDAVFKLFLVAAMFWVAAGVWL